MLRLLMVLALFAFPAAAQDVQKKAGTPPLLMLQQYEATHPERVVIAFHKAARHEPDFLNWARQSPYLQGAAPSDRDSIISREDNRLRRQWSEYDANEPLVVHTTIHLDDYSTLQEQLHLSEFTPKTFFSFSMYNENIAIVPKDMAMFNKLSLTRAQMDEMLKKAGGGQVTAELLLKPTVSDAKIPFIQNGTTYWLLLAEIGEIRFWTNSRTAPQLLWMQRAEWFKPKENSTLMNLKSGTQ